MTQYLKGQFSVLPPTSQEFRDNFDRTFGKREFPRSPTVIRADPKVDTKLDADQAPCSNCATGGHDHCLTPGTCKCYFCLRDKFSAAIRAMNHLAHRDHEFSPTTCTDCDAGWDFLANWL